MTTPRCPPTQTQRSFTTLLDLLPCSLIVSDTQLLNYLKVSGRDFPGGAVVENPPAKAGDTGSSPGLGRSHRPQSN